MNADKNSWVHHSRTFHSENCQVVRKLEKRNLSILMDQRDEDRKSDVKNFEQVLFILKL